MEKVALVTGARHRLGEAITRHLLEQGWRVFAHVRDAADEVAGGADKVVADLSHADCGERIFAQIDGPPPALLVNNASLFEEDRFGAIDAEGFQRQMAVNARAPMLLTDAFANAEAPVGSDRLIVNMGDAKLAAPHPDHLSYTLTKGALKTLTDVSARALAGQGIRVNMIAPAMVLPSPDMSEAQYEAMHAFNPLGRGVDKAHLLAALDHLIANTVVTGTCLWLDGGQRMMQLKNDVALIQTDDVAEERE